MLHQPSGSKQLRLAHIFAPLQAVGPYLNADQVLADILMPISSSMFFSSVWEQTPLFISRPSLRQWYSNWLSEDHIFELLSKGGSDDLKYGHNLDVTRYIGTVSPASAIWHALQIQVAQNEALAAILLVYSFSWCRRDRTLISMSILLCQTTQLTPI